MTTTITSDVLHPDYLFGTPLSPCPDVQTQELTPAHFARWQHYLEWLEIDGFPKDLQALVLKADYESREPRAQASLIRHLAGVA